MFRTLDHEEIKQKMTLNGVRVEGKWLLIVEGGDQTVVLNRLRGL